MKATRFSRSYPRYVLWAGTQTILAFLALGKLMPFVLQKIFYRETEDMRYMYPGVTKICTGLRIKTGGRL